MSICYIIGLMSNTLYLLYSHIIFVEILLNPLIFLISTFIYFVLKANMRWFPDEADSYYYSNNHTGSP